MRRLTVALSRARLGLYVLGRRSVFESCFELREAFDKLLSRSTTLEVVQGELFPTSRGVLDDVQSTEMTGVEHLGQYVYTMSQAKLKQLQSLPPSDIQMDLGNDEANGEEEDAVEVFEAEEVDEPAADEEVVR